MTARLQHHPASSRATATAAMVELSLTAIDLLAWTQVLLLEGELTDAEPKKLRYGYCTPPRESPRAPADCTCGSPPPGPGATTSRPPSPDCRHCPGPSPEPRRPPCPPTTRGLGETGRRVGHSACSVPELDLGPLPTSSTRLSQPQTKRGGWRQWVHGVRSAAPWVALARSRTVATVGSSGSRCARGCSVRRVSRRRPAARPRRRRFGRPVPVSPACTDPPRRVGYARVRWAGLTRC